MSGLAILFLRTGLAFFVAGMVIGAIGLAEPSRLTHGRRVSHTHLLLVGWLLNTVIGVAWWMFPRLPGTVAAPRFVLAGWAALNGGLLLRAVTDLAFGGMIGAPIPVRWGSAALQLGGAVLLAALLWRRVRPPARRPAPPGRSGL